MAFLEGDITADLYRPADPSTDLPAEAVRDELARILASKALRNTDRLKRFIRFVVDETLDGRGGLLKEYTIAVEVFDRPPSHDPRADPVVRVEARRLRSKLRDYYETDGLADAVVIDLPKGGYVPVFRRRPAPSEAAATPRAAQPDGEVDSRAAGTGARRYIAGGRWLSLRGVVAVGLFAILIAGGSFGLVRSLRTRGPEVPTIAVLPFENVSADPDNEHFCFGVVEELTTALAQVEGLRVVARTSASQFHGGMDITEIARRLHANLLLEGSVRRSGDRLRVTAQLISAADGSHLWARTYERTVDNVFATQDEIAQAVTEVLRITTVAPARVARRSPADADAYILFLKGQYFRNRVGAGDLKTSITFLEQAIARDPRLAPAHAELAAAYTSFSFGAPVPPEREMRLAQASARRAIELDPSLADPHALLAWIAFFYDWDWQGAERGFRRAIELNPNLAEAYHRYGILLLAERRFSEALDRSKKALDLDPLSPRISANRALIFLCERRNEDAIRQAREALEIAPSYSLANIFIGSALADERRYDEAIQAYRRALESTPDDSDAAASLGRVYALAGQRDRARAVAADLASPSRSTPASRYQLAFLAAGLGEPDRAFSLLDEAYARHETELVFLAVDPLFDQLRGDARFGMFLRKLGFAR